MKEMRLNNTFFTKMLGNLVIFHNQQLDSAIKLKIIRYKVGFIENKDFLNFLDYIIIFIINYSLIS